MEKLGFDFHGLFAARFLRLFAYGFLSVSLTLYLTKLGISEQLVGFLLTLALFGDIFISLAITTSADRLGRRRMLIISALLIILAGGVLASTDNIWLIGLAALVGVISPSGGEIGPFLSIEQAALTQLIADKERTRIFAWYNLTGSFATALGALASGVLVQSLQHHGLTELASYRSVLVVYAGIGGLLGLLFVTLSSRIEIRPAEKNVQTANRFGLHKSKATVAKLSGLFALDAFGGGFIIQSILAYWVYRRFQVQPVILGSIFFGANILAGISALLAERLARRIGLINTMVYTHIPSNILLMLVPFMPTLSAAIAVLLLRASISQMDVPTRQSYTMAVVSPDERSAASGITTIARSVGALVSPSLAGWLLAIPGMLAAPFLLAGSLKIVYDLLLYRSFRALKPPEEKVGRDP